MLIFESKFVNAEIAADAIVTKLLSDWIQNDKSLKLNENKGLISRIGNVPIILC